jgi:hypothetical protein
MKKRLLILLSVVVVLSIAILAAVFVYQLRTSEEAIPLTEKEPLFAYGINVDSLEIVPGEVRANQNLSILLSPDVSGQVIDLIARTTRDVFEVRKIKPGQKYSKFFTRDSLRHLDYFVYEINDTAFVVYDLRDSLRAFVDYKTTERVTKTVC